MEYDITDINLAEKGKKRIDWAAEAMPVQDMLEARFRETKPFQGIRLSACLHVTTETGRLARTLKAGGAEVRLCASNPLSTQDDVAASLVKHDEISVFATHGEDRDTYYKHINQTLDHEPHLTMDDGCDLVSTVHSDRKELIKGLIGGSEETTTGVIRLKSMSNQGVLQYPIVAVNDAQTKHMFDNRYGTGQSTIDGIIRATNRLLAGTCFVIAGYGWCGRGVANKARGMGANVIITEVDPLRALEAQMDGFRVMPMEEAAPIGDFFCTLTGDINVVDTHHFEKMKDKAIVCNSGHFNVELNLEGLAKMAVEQRNLRGEVEEYRLKDGRRINVLAEGRLVNLAAAEGHPSSVMDMSFANQAMCAAYLVSHGKELENKVYPVPTAIDEEIAKMKLEAMKINIDVLTEEQETYLNSWQMGT
jgi:adenosylhomocysteinase